MTEYSENKENDRVIVEQVSGKQDAESKNEKPKRRVGRPPKTPRSNRATELRNKKLNDSVQCIDKFFPDTSLNKTASPLPAGKKNQNKPLLGKNKKEESQKADKTNSEACVLKLSVKLGELSTDNTVSKTSKKSVPLRNRNSSLDTELSESHKKPLTRVPKNGKKPRSTNKKVNHEPPSHKITDFFKYRKTERQLKKDYVNQTLKDLEKKILDYCEDGLEIKVFEEKGRGIVTSKQFFKGDFVLEYVGDLLKRAEAKQREEEYSKNTNIGCYMYYFKHKDTQYCIDATAESGKFGRLVNHSRKGANLVSKIIEIEKVPHLVFFAKVDISVGTELMYDYGDRSKNSVLHHPWLTN